MKSFVRRPKSRRLCFWCILQDMTLFHEQARAKINLTLKILGKRPDGFHEIESLVAFANTGDKLVLDTGLPARLAVDGPFGVAIEGANIVETILSTLAARFTGIALGAVKLTKNLPIASGIGGGSSDAGALLRAIRRANPALAETVDWIQLAEEFGADVPVCFANTAAWMLGKGERVVPLATPLPRFSAVLANPLVPVPADKTARVFRRLNASPVTGGTKLRPLPDVSTAPNLIALMSSDGNDLAAPACDVVPAALNALNAIGTRPGLLAHGLSGAGPTAFALFDTIEHAEQAACDMKSAYPSWWITATTIA
jgi:4-diphosphocytidyl-2-C-methyl-D-erythritol kinase